MTGHWLGLRWLKMTADLSPDECWDWPFGRERNGYGLCFWEGRQRRATHVALKLLRGIDVPPGMVACHTCDNPPCVNPDHLFVGTRADNNRDRELKGRGRARRSLTDDQVRRVRAERTVMLKVFAEEYGVTVSALSRVRRCQTYRHVT